MNKRHVIVRCGDDGWLYLDFVEPNGDIIKSIRWGMLGGDVPKINGGNQYYAIRDWIDKAKMPREFTPQEFQS